MDEITLPSGLNPRHFAIWENVLVRLSDDSDVGWYDHVDNEWVYSDSFLLCGMVDDDG